jgi:hypothetical protein
MKCQKCGFANPPGLLFCGNCGTRLAAASDIPASPTLTIAQPQEPLGRGSLLAGRFEVLEEIGSGGMGTVYRVLDKKINEDVALKLLRPEVAADKSIIERFKNELKIARMFHRLEIVFDRRKKRPLDFRLVYIFRQQPVISFFWSGRCFCQAQRDMIPNNMKKEITIPQPPQSTFRLYVASSMSKYRRRKS